MYCKLNEPECCLALKYSWFDVPCEKSSINPQTSSWGKGNGLDISKCSLVYFTKLHILCFHDKFDHDICGLISCEFVEYFKLIGYLSLVTLIFRKMNFLEREYQTAQIIFSVQKPFGLQMEKYLKTSIRNDSILLLDETFCAIWFYLLKPATLLKVTLFHGGLSRILNCTKVTKSRKSSHILCV